MARQRVRVSARRGRHGGEAGAGRGEVSEGAGRAREARAGAAGPFSRGVPAAPRCQAAADWAPRRPRPRAARCRALAAPRSVPAARPLFCSHPGFQAEFGEPVWAKAASKDASRSLKWERRSPPWPRSGDVDICDLSVYASAKKEKVFRGAVEPGGVASPPSKLARGRVPGSRRFTCCPALPPLPCLL